MVRIGGVDEGDAQIVETGGVDKPVYGGLSGGLHIYGGLSSGG